MAELYRWFLHWARRGLSLIDAIAKAAVRWATYPATLIYNAALSAYSSFYTAIHMNENPQKTLGDIIQHGSNIMPVFGSIYNPNQLVDMFPLLVGTSYSARTLAYSGSGDNMDYASVDTPLSSDKSWEDIANEVSRRYESLCKSIDCNDYKLVLQFVLGEPKLIVMSK